MPINYNQQDSAFRPLNGFLFRCEFHVVGNSNITKDILKKLEYSVSTVKLPKMKEMEAEPHSFGSFFIPFPFFSTGEKDMTIEFYETDDMLISKVFYSFLNRYRWKSSTMFDKEQADLSVTVTIYDQRNLYGSSNRPLYRNIYWLKTTDLEPPQFSRSGSDVDLCKVTVTFNTIESDYKNAIDSSEFGNTNEINLGADDDPAFENTDELGNKIAEMFDELLNGSTQETTTGKQPSGSGLTGLTGKKYKIGSVHSKRYKVEIKEEKKVAVDGSEATVWIVDGDNFDQNGRKKIKINTMIWHTQATDETSLDYAIRNTESQGIGSTSDQYGNIILNIDAAYKKTAGLGNKKSGGKSVLTSEDFTFAHEFTGDVALFYDEASNTYYARNAKGMDKGVDYVEITKEEFEERGGKEYTEESMEGNRGLISAKEYELGQKHKVKMKDGTVKEVSFTNMYDSKLTDLDVESAKRLGKSMAESGEFEIDIENLKFMSHGMGLEHEWGKSEMLPDRARLLGEAFIEGWQSVQESKK